MSKLKSSREDVEESPLIFVEPASLRRNNKTRNEALVRLNEKLKEITRGKEVNNYLDADLEDCNLKGSLCQEIKTPI